MVEKSKSLEKEGSKDFKNKELVLFFTRGVSLATWDRVGNLYREIEIYNCLASYFKKIYFITYGKKSDELQYRELLKDNIIIISKKIPFFIPNRIYIFLIPFLLRRIFKKAHYLKTNQMIGSLAAVVVKFMYKKSLIVRCGYEYLRSLELYRKYWYKLKAVYFIEKFVYSHADRILITSNDNLKFIKDNFKIPDKKITVIPNYINTEIFKPLPNILKERNRICYVGRLENRQKNLYSLITAISNLPVKLTIFGSGELRDNLEHLAKEVNANVEFKGNISNKDLPKELNKCEVFILPSFFEGNPKALLEAMACGLPCIGTNVEGIKEIIQHGENGYLCETDSQSIRKAILEVLNDKNLQGKLGKNARQTIINNFSLEKILEKEIEIYKNL